MAAAVVPSRARAQARAPGPSENPVTFVCMTLRIDQLHGELQLPPKQYFFRWMRAGKQAKVSAAKSYDPEIPFNEKMALYARVKRHGPVFISEDETDPLDTSLVLCSTEPNSEQSPIVVSTVAFDIAYYLSAIVEARSKTLTSTIQMPASVSLSVGISIKVIGGNDLQPYVPMEVSAQSANGLVTPPPDTSADMDEAVAALELEKLRQRFREKERRLEALEQSTDRLDRAVHEHASEDVASLQMRIQSLEDEYATSEQNRAEAERKVAAHVAHAAKIKDTYKQLATWYNKLREEHAELQKKVPQSDGDQGSSSRSLPAAGVSISSDEDYGNLQRERDELRDSLERERSEYNETYSRNSQLLESKARALADLREQWDAAQNTLQTTREQSDEHSRALKEMQDNVDELKRQLEEKDSAMQESSIAASNAENAIKDMETRHAQALRMMRNETLEEAMSNMGDELNSLREQHQEDLRRVTTEAKTEHESHLEEALQQLRLANEAEVESLKQRLQLEHEELRKEELDRMTSEYEEKLVAEAEMSHRKVHESENAALLSNQAAANLEDERGVLEQRIEGVKQEYEEKLRETELRIQSLQISHAKELEDVKLQKDEANIELRSFQEQSVVEKDVASSREIEYNNGKTQLEEECSNLRSQVAILEKENNEIRSSPRQINALASGSGNEEIAAHLNNEISQLKVLLKTETENRNETVHLLANADREHDELREMVTRLRSERDTAQNELKAVKEAVPDTNIRDATIQRNLSPDTSPNELCEERDKAIREVFRTRKEIRRLKKQNLGLQEQLEQAPSPEAVKQGEDNSVVLAELTEERNRAEHDVKDLRVQVAKVTDELASAKKAAESESDAGIELRKQLAAKESEMETLRKKASDLENAERLIEQLRSENTNVVNQVDSLKSSHAAAQADIRVKEERLAQITADMESSSREVSDTKHRNDEISKERDSARNKSSALQIELDSLKKSLSDVTSSTSSAETLLREAQKEVAESKAEIDLLRSEIEDTKKAASQREDSLSREISALKTAVGESQNVAEERLLRLTHIEEKNSEQTSRLQKLEAANIAIAADLEARRLERVEAEKKVKDIETELSRATSSEREQSNTILKLSEEGERLRNAAGDASKRLDIAEKVAKDKEAEVAGLTAELDVSKRNLENEVQTRSSASEKDAAAVGELEAVIRNLKEEISSLQGKLEGTQKELRVLRESYGSMEEELEEVHEKAVLVQDRSAEHERVALDASSKLAEAQATNEKRTAEYRTLLREHKNLEYDVVQLRDEADQLRDERTSLAKKIAKVEQDMEALNEKMYLMQEESDECLAQERGEKEREVKKAQDARKELRSARALVESLQAEVEQVKSESAQLQQAKEKGESNESEVLNDLINTRLELAYAQEEAVRLRNKLTKIAQKGPGSVSFET